MNLRKSLKFIVIMAFLIVANVFSIQKTIYYIKGLKNNYLEKLEREGNNFVNTNIKQVNSILNMVAGLSIEKPVLNLFEEKETNPSEIIELKDLLNKIYNYSIGKNYRITVGNPEKDLVVSTEGSSEWKYFEKGSWIGKIPKRSDMEINFTKEKVEIFLKRNLNLDGDGKEGIFFISISKKGFLRYFDGEGDWIVVNKNGDYFYLSESLEQKFKEKDVEKIIKSGKIYEDKFGIRYIQIPDFYNVNKMVVRAVAVCILFFIASCGAVVYSTRSLFKNFYHPFNRSVKIKLLREVILGVKKPGEFEEQYPKHWLSKKEEYRLLLLGFDEFLYEEEKYTKELQSLLKGQLKEKIGKISEYESINMDYKTFLVVIKDKENIFAEVTEVLNELNKEHKTDITGLLGEGMKGISEIEEKYKEEIKYLEHKFALGNSVLITEEEIKVLEKDIFFYPIDSEIQIINRCLKGESGKVEELLEIIFDENFEKRKLPVSEFEKLKKLMTNTMRRIVSKAAEREKKFFQYEEQMEGVEEVPISIFRKRYLEIMHRIAEEISSFNPDEKEGMKNKILDFINMNYCKDTSLVELGDYLGLSSGYASVLFKETMGENFLNYINRYKVEKAKEIMQNNREIKILELAEQLGFNSSVSFIRTFKRIEGVSPGKYLEELTI